MVLIHIFYVKSEDRKVSKGQSSRVRHFHTILLSCSENIKSTVRYISSKYLDHHVICIILQTNNNHLEYEHFFSSAKICVSFMWYTWYCQ